MTFVRQPVLEGELVILRSLRHDDFDSLYAIASDRLLWELHPSKDRTQQVVFQRWFDQALASECGLAVIERDTGAVVGTSPFNNYDAERSQIGL